LDEVFSAVQNMAVTSVNQEAALVECNEKRKGLVDLIDLSNGAKP